MGRVESREKSADSPERVSVLSGKSLKEEISCSSSATESTSTRYKWSNQAEFLLSLIGYAVSLGNVWRFPYLCYRNGGGAFLIPYWIMLFVCGIPLFFMEVVMGQFSSSGAVDVWNFCPLLKGVGIGTVLLTAIGSTSYNLLIALIFYFLFSSFKSDLPWGHCDLGWNTDACVILKSFNTTRQLAMVNGTGLADLKTSAYEYWSHEVLKITDGLHNLGSINLKLMGCFILAWVLTFLCLIRGIKSAGKIVYFTATFPYLILTVLLVRSALLPGATKGIIFFLKPDWSKLRTFRIWNEAATQIFYSLGPGWSGLITMASYNKFRNNCLKDSISVSVVNCATSIYAGLVVFSVVGFMSHILSIPIEKVATQGVGLAFIVYPEALLHLPLPNLWSILFFTMLLTVGIDTIFVQLEVVYSAIYDALPLRYKSRRVCFTLVASVIMMLLGTPFLLKGGIYLFQLLDWYLAILSVMIFCLFECIAITWIYGADRFIQDIEFMLNKPLVGARFWIIMWKYIVPLLLTIALIFNVVFHVPVQYGNYVYPSWATSIGWIISVSSLTPIPIYAAYALCTAKGSSFSEKLSYSLKPSRKWGPSCEPFRSQYLEEF